MKDTKLIQILETISKTEMNAFEKYVKSPFFNNNVLVVALVGELKVFHPEYLSEHIDRRIIYSKLFKNSVFNEQKMRHLMTDVTRLLEDFLAYREWMNDTIPRKQLLISALQKRNLSKYVKQHLSRAKEENDQSRFQDSHYFKNTLALEEADYLYSATKNNRKSGNQLQKLVDTIDIQYLSKKLKYSCEIINRQNILKEEYELPFLEKTIEFLKDYAVEEVPAVAIYFRILLTLQEPENAEHYNQLRSLLREHYTKFPKLELRDMFAFAQNYCIRKINTGNPDFLNELFDIYLILLEQKIILDGKYLAHFDFKNIITVALRLEKQDWVEQFIEDYKSSLRKDLRKNSINYNQAQLHFARKEYKKSLKLLLAVEFTDVYYHLDSKTLLLKTYFELDETEPLFSLINSFRVYVRRNKQISDYQRITYNNLLLFVAKLQRVRLGSRKPIEAIKKEIEQVKQIADLTWLNSKVAELE